MGRKNAGPQLTKKRNPAKDEIRYVRFTHEGKPYYLSTGERDLDRATKKAAQLHADVVNGRLQVKEEVVAPSAALSTGTDLLFAQHFAAKTGILDPETLRWRKMKSKHVIAKFPLLGDLVADGAIKGYVTKRLKEVQRFTVVREISMIFCMLEDREVTPMPPRPKIPEVEGTVHYRTKKTKDGEVRTKQRDEPIQITEEEMAKILAHLPERAKRPSKHGEEPMPLRAFFAFMWETGLRPATIAKISIPEHWSPFGKARGDLRISKAIDKVRFKRTVPLTPRAQAILQEVSGGEAGVIFGHPQGRSTRWRYFKDAAIAAGVERAAEVAPYDVRHGRITDLVARSGGNLGGTAYLVGHEDITTTAHYSKPNEKQARAMPGFGAGPQSGENSGGVEAGVAKNAAI